MGLLTPNKIIAEGQPASINYNYQDVSAGTGLVTFYAGTASGASVLSNNVFFSDSISSTSSLITSKAFIQVLDKDFDVTFNLPQIMRGTAIVEVPMLLGDSGASADTTYVYIVARIRKWDGTNEIEVASGSSGIWTCATGGANVYNYNVRTAKFEVPITQYKAGESLRLTIEAWAKEATANNHKVIIGHDPQNRDSQDGWDFPSTAYNGGFTSGATILKAQIPFRIEV